MNAKSKNPTALESFMRTRAATFLKLEKLNVLAHDNFNFDPDTIDWSHVGSLTYLNQLLDEANRFITNTQE